MQNDIVKPPKQSPPDGEQPAVAPQEKKEDKPVISDPRAMDIKPAKTPEQTKPAESEASYDAAAANSKKPKSSLSKVAVALAVFVFLGLGGLAVYVGLNQKSSPQTANSATPTPTTDQTAAVDAKESLSQIISELEQLPTDEDTSETDLSDAALGL